MERSFKLFKCFRLAFLICFTSKLYAADPALLQETSDKIFLMAGDSIIVPVTKEENRLRRPDLRGDDSPALPDGFFSSVMKSATFNRLRTNGAQR